ncbi:DUF7503 family protein [Halorussus sp. AFM4]
MARTSDITAWLADNPKLMGALWAVALLLAESGSAVADCACAKSGP